jgi:twitching motility protein PilT
MQTFDQSIYDLLQKGLISYDTALENASNPDDFKLRVQGISGTAESTRDHLSQQLGRF